MKLAYWFFLVLLGTQSLAQSVKSLDLTSRPDADKYFVVLCGRNNTATGHAFVVWGKEDAAAAQSVVEGAFGLYPKETGEVTADGIRIVKAFFAKVPGEIADEFYKGSLRHDLVRLVIQVDKEDYDRTFNIKNVWEGRDDFRILENDCVTFASEVGRALKLTIPPRQLTDRPWGYLEKILQANQQENFVTGSWESSDAAHRFRLVITLANCTWTERSPGGASISRTMEVTNENGFLKVYRPNDAAVLGFLGFPPNVAGQVLSRGANPSFIVLKRIDLRRLQGQWNGLLVTKDNNGNVREVKQPGSMPPKQFDFTWSQ